jgi:hypothetical protein
MGEQDAVASERANRAHELYWHSELGVNAIAGELGLSKSRFYEFVRPIPAGRPCPECGRDLVFSTRTARDRGEAECPDRCVEVDLDPAEAPSPATLDTGRILAGVLLGAAAVVLLARLVRR